MNQSPYGPPTLEQEQEILTQTTEWMNNVIIRADDTVDALLDKAIEEVRVEKKLKQSGKELD